MVKWSAHSALPEFCISESHQSHVLGNSSIVGKPGQLVILPMKSAEVFIERPHHCSPSPSVQFCFHPFHWYWSQEVPTISLLHIIYTPGNPTYHTHLSKFNYRTFWDIFSLNITFHTLHYFLQGQIRNACWISSFYPPLLFLILPFKLPPPPSFSLSLWIC